MSTVRNRTGKVRFARAMPTTNPRTGMLWERDWSSTYYFGCDYIAPSLIIIKPFAPLGCLLAGGEGKVGCVFTVLFLKTLFS